MKIDFKQFQAYTSLKGDTHAPTDAREHVANCVYMAATGVYAYSLALKILNSEGEMELDPREEKTVELSLAERGLSFVYASFLRAKENKEIETENSK